MAIIGLQGIEIQGFHGVMPHEKVQGNRFEIDVYVEVNDPLPDSDLIEDALDYGDIYRIVDESFAGNVNLLETLVLRIGNSVMIEFSQAASVRVRVSKLSPPIIGIANRSFVEEVFTRE